MKVFATITVIGKDKTGVVARITNFLFEQKANIEALEEQVTRGQFSMTIQASWAPREFSVESLRKGLSELARLLGMEIKLRHTEPHRRQRMAIMVTRETHCFEGLMAAFESGKLKQAEPAVIISNRRDLKSVATDHNLPFVHVPWVERAPAEQKVLAVLDRFEADFVVLARFMKILSP